MRYFVVDAFTRAHFSGNPAGVCLVDAWPEPALMQRIAGENNLPETAFIRRDAAGWHIRWLTPSYEIDLCGHATLAAGHVILTRLEPELDAVGFTSPSGPLAVARRGALLALDLPARPPRPVDTPPLLAQVLGARVLACAAARDLIILLEDAETVAGLAPDPALLRRIPGYLGFVPTAPGRDCDFVSRFFDPHDAIFEDPVTGSAHCSLVPFWHARLGRANLEARQLSPRGGRLWCRDLGDRVEVAGHALLYLEGALCL